MAAGLRRLRVGNGEDGTHGKRLHPAHRELLRVRPLRDHGVLPAELQQDPVEPLHPGRVHHDVVLGEALAHRLPDVLREGPRERI